MKKISFFGKIGSFKFSAGVLITLFIVFICGSCQDRHDNHRQILKRAGISRGICVLLEDKGCKLAINLAQQSEFLIYVQLTRADDTEIARRAADDAGFYGTRIFVERGELGRIHIADNLVDVLVAAEKGTNITESEALRVLRPEGKAFIGRKRLTKPFPEGIDEWSHPYHGPDNNPQSEDEIARAPYLTHFLADPFYAPFPQVTVASGGRVFQAYGHIAFHEREEALLNSLVAYNGYNGTVLWKRKLTPGFMIHRNTFIATPEVLYVADDKSCKVIDCVSGKLKDEIIPPLEIAGGTFWKWMALENKVLYALIGDQEQKDPNIKSRRESHGWPWVPLTKGFNQPENPWGYGRNLLAINPRTKKVLWSHRETEAIDSRALCMKNGRIYIYRYGAFLACLDAKDGKYIWRKTPDNSPELFNAIGASLNRQDWRTNWRTTAYLKCSDDALYFAGPTVGKLLVVSAKDGNILWENPYDNFQLVLSKDGLYGISNEIDTQISKKFDPLTGKVLAEIETRRRACTRPTGTIDAVIFRAQGGSTRIDMESDAPQWISPMRPTCHDGVTITNGLLYWWPSVCDCQATLYGITCLGPAGDFDFSQKATEEERLEQYDLTNVTGLDETSLDWPTYRADNCGTLTTEALISERNQCMWWLVPDHPFTPTASVAAGGFVFYSGSDGIVRAVESSTGELRWKAYTGGPVRFPPTVWEGRLLVGSGDGYVYAFEALTGRLLWKFRAAPAHRKIPVYGSLMSTWPVASGVLIEKGIAYFAAGIVNYDGTHVYALDAASGKIKWQNNTSGHLDSEARTGVSVQGHMLINDGKLYLASGTSLSPAIFDLEDGQCLNDPAPLKLCGSSAPRGWELYKIGDKVVVGGQPFYGDPDYPVYDPSVTEKMLYTSANGMDIFMINNRKIMSFKTIDKQFLNNSVYEQAKEPVFMVRKWGELNIKDKPVWEYDCGEAVAMVRCKNTVIISTNFTRDRQRNYIEAIDISNGNRLWSEPLLSAPLPWGLIVDRDGRIIVTLEDGQIMCFGQNNKDYVL
jgi:outer membrane protein assembly factor BamB